MDRSIRFLKSLDEGIRRECLLELKFEIDQFVYVNFARIPLMRYTHTYTYIYIYIFIQHEFQTYSYRLTFETLWNINFWFHIESR